jgi:hypothetical protein
MSLANDTELANTRVKLALLQKRYDALRGETTGDAYIREVTMRSVKRTINQFIEEIARYESRQLAKR